MKKFYLTIICSMAVVLGSYYSFKSHINYNAILKDNIEALTGDGEEKKYTYRECYKAATSTQITKGRVCNNSTDLSVKAWDVFKFEYIDQLWTVLTGKDYIIQGTYPCLDTDWVQAIPIMHGLCYYQNY